MTGFSWAVITQGFSCSYSQIDTGAGCPKWLTLITGHWCWGWLGCKLVCQPEHQQMTSHVAWTSYSIMIGFCERSYQERIFSRDSRRSCKASYEPALEIMKLHNWYSPSIKNKLQVKHRTQWKGEHKRMNNKRYD